MIVPTFSLAKGSVSPRPRVEWGEEPFDADDSHLVEKEGEEEEEISSKVSELEDRVPLGLGFRMMIGLPSTWGFKIVVVVTSTDSVSAAETVGAAEEVGAAGDGCEEPRCGWGTTGAMGR